MTIAEQARQLLAEDPLFVSGSDAEKESAVRANWPDSDGRMTRMIILMAEKLAAVGDDPPAAVEAPASPLAEVRKEQAKAVLVERMATARAARPPAVNADVLGRATTALGLSDSAMGEAMGVTRQTVYAWRHGASGAVSGPRRDTLERLLTQRRFEITQLLDAIAAQA